MPRCRYKILTIPDVIYRVDPLRGNPMNRTVRCAFYLHVLCAAVTLSSTVFANFYYAIYNCRDRCICISMPNLTWNVNGNSAELMRCAGPFRMYRNDQFLHASFTVNCIVKTVSPINKGCWIVEGWQKPLTNFWNGFNNVDISDNEDYYKPV